MKKGFKSIIAILLSIVFVSAMLPATKVEASSVTVNGGHTSRSNPYIWGSYSQYNSILVVLPQNEDDFWVSVNLPSNSHVFARCSYDNDYEGMRLESLFSTTVLDEQNSSTGVYDADTIIPFLAVKLDNTNSSTRTYLIHVNRGNAYEGIMYFTISMGERYKTGHGTFNFSGTASNSGNNPVSTAGRDSSILTLDLSSSTVIPANAIVTSVSTSGTQSPNQGNVHHMIMPSNPGTWYTSTYSSATSGSYPIVEANNVIVGQRWSFKYNALATAKSTMRSVSISFNWRYDIADTGYHTFGS